MLDPDHTHMLQDPLPFWLKFWAEAFVRLLAMPCKGENTKALGLLRRQLFHWILVAGLSSDKLVHARLTYVAAWLPKKQNAECCGGKPWR